MKKPDMECAREMAITILIWFKSEKSTDKIMEMWKENNLIDNEERTCEHCGGKEEWKALCINPNCKNYAR